MVSKILREAFGLGGPAATRQTGFIARFFYGLGLAAALLWVSGAYWAVILDHGRGVYSFFEESYELPSLGKKVYAVIDEGERVQKARLKKAGPLVAEKERLEALQVRTESQSKRLSAIKARLDADYEAATAWIDKKFAWKRAWERGRGEEPPEWQEWKKALQFEAIGFFAASFGVMFPIFLLVTAPRFGLIKDFSHIPFVGKFLNEFLLPIVLAPSGLAGMFAVFASIVTIKEGVASGADYGLVTWQAVFAFGVPALMIFGPAAAFMAWQYVKEIPWYREKFILPKSPASRWGGIRAFLRYDIGDFFPKNASKIAEQDQSTIYLGRTFAEQDPRIGGRHIGLRSEQHMMTVAMTGAGKSRDALWNTLLSWSGGVFVFDPKGEHMQVTYGRRSHYRNAYALDPYRMAPHIAETAHYNPLDEINPDSPTAGADIMTIVENSLYIEKTEAANTAHFRENAQAILKGFIAHLLTRYPTHQRNLPAVFDLLATGALDGEAYNIKAVEKVLDDMKGNAAIGKAPMFAIKILNDVSPREAGGYLSTIYRGIKWVSSPPVRRTLMCSDFTMGQLKSHEITVYLVLPRRRVPEQIRWVRTLTSMAMFMCEETAQPAGSKRKVLMCLDEFPQLGTFKPVQSGLVTVRSAGIKLWVLMQNIGALNELYENAQDFFSSCDQQYFGVNSTDNLTSKHISEALGRYLREHREGKAGETHHQEHERELLNASAVGQMLRKDGQNQIVFPAGGLPLKLVRVPFYKNCTGGYGRVQDLKAQLTQEQIDAQTEELERPIRAAREKARKEAEREAQKAAKEAQKVAQAEARKRAKEKAKEEAKKRAFYANMEIEPKFEEVAGTAGRGRGRQKSWRELYTETQNEARERWALEIGFIKAGLDARYIELIHERPANEADGLSDDYATLLPVAA